MNINFDTQGIWQPGCIAESLIARSRESILALLKYQTENRLFYRNAANKYASQRLTFSGTDAIPTIRQEENYNRRIGLKSELKSRRIN